ncbi:MAG: adenosine-specific kinase, partial [Sulfolobales archaeon]
MEGVNVILGQSHFIKTVEDIYEALVTSVPNIKFGIAFCESSGKRLIRYDGNDEEMISLAIEATKRVGAGHFFAIYIRNAWPINVINSL